MHQLLKPKSAPLEFILDICAMVADTFTYVDTVMLQLSHLTQAPVDCTGQHVITPGV